MGFFVRWTRRVSLVTFVVHGGACSSTSSGSGGGGSDGGGGGGAAPTTVEVAEKEPNDGPDANGAQDVGTIVDGETLVISGELSSGGNDGKKYTGDFDLFLFAIEAAGSIDISVDWTGDADVDVALYDEKVSSQLAADGTTAKPAKASLASASAGKYVLALFSKDKPAPYKARITFKKAAGGPTPSADCPTTTPIAAATAGGCFIGFVTPKAACETADLSGGKTFQIGWTTMQTYCEGPHHVSIAGDPPSSWQSGNAITININSQDGSSHEPDSRYGMTRNIGGYLNITAQDLAQLSSPSGIYYVGVSNFSSGSHTEARAIRVKK